MEHIHLLGLSLHVLHIAAPKNAVAQTQRGAALPRLAAAAPIVFLHEGLGCIEMWRDFPQQLCAATGRAGWVISRQGYGQSSPHTAALPFDYMQREAWDVLPAVLGHLGVANPVLLGHSDGATIALLYASRYAGLNACIAMAPHLFVEPVSLESIRKVRHDFEHGDLRAKLARFHADVDGAFYGWNRVWLSDEFRQFNIEADCAKIACPLLAIQGAQDAYGTMAQIDALLDINKQNSRSPAYPLVRQLLKLEQCGHSPQRDQPAKVISAIVYFLKSLP